MWTTTTISLGAGITIALYILAFYAVVLAITRGHGVEGTLAWLFAILAFPGIGAIAYLLLASPSIKRTTKRKKKTIAALRKAIPRGISDEQLREMPAASIMRMAYQLTYLTPKTGNQIEILSGSVSAFEHIEAALKSAKKSIWAEYYIIQHDETGKRFMDILAAKAKEGIEVKLLYDALGSLSIDAEALKQIQAAGGKVEVFLPLNPFRRRWSMHLRNHRKIIVVDGDTGFMGGMNVGDEYSGSGRKKADQRFRDTHMSLRGPAVFDLALIFAEDWTFATEAPLDPPAAPAEIPGAKSIVSIIPSGPDQEFNANAFTYFSGIATAREKVCLTSPYFIPADAIIRALISAAMRGVDVRLLVPRKNDIRVVGSAGRAFYPELIRGGVKIFEYLPTMLHGKTMVVDGKWGIVGSANVDIRSFRLNFEIGAIIVDPDIAKILEDKFNNDIANSEEITSAHISRRRFLQKLRYGTARLLSPLL